MIAGANFFSTDRPTTAADHLVVDCCHPCGCSLSSPAYFREKNQDGAAASSWQTSATVRHAKMTVRNNRNFQHRDHHQKKYGALFLVGTIVLLVHPRLMSSSARVVDDNTIQTMILFYDEPCCSPSSFVFPLPLFLILSTPPHAPPPKWCDG